MSHGTRYKLENESEGSLLDYSKNRAACFAAYGGYSGAGSNGWTGKNVITLYIDKKFPDNVTANMLLTKEQILKHLEKLQPIFPTTFKEEENQYLVILQEKDYKNMTHVRTALDFLRLLWENDINQVLVKYFEIEKEIQNLDYLSVLQVLHIWLGFKLKTGYYGMLQGHALPSGYTGFILSSKDFLKELNKPENEKMGSTVLWRTCSKNENRAHSHGYGMPSHITERKIPIMDIEAKDEKSINELIKLINKKKEIVKSIPVIEFNKKMRAF